MKFLLDNQLPAALARFLTTHGHDAQHVLDLQLAEAADAAIWRQAGFEGRVVVSKDGDFLHFATRPDAKVTAKRVSINRSAEWRWLSPKTTCRESCASPNPRRF